MMKLIGIAILVLLVGMSWFMFYKAGDEGKSLLQQIYALEEEGDIDEEIPALKTEMLGLEGQRTFSGILLAFLSAGLFGIVFVTMVLPLLAQKVTHAVYDSGEMVEQDVMHDARVLVAQGQWAEAIAAFRDAAAQDPMNRLPWVEIAKIQKVHLEDPFAAIQTFREAIESHEWKENDAAFMMFRLAELYDEDAQDRSAAVTIMEQVMEQFPESRHSANARHKLHEWGVV